MTDKQKIRNGVEKLKSQLIRGACSSQLAMETRCKEEAYNEVLAMLDSMQEKPNDDWKYSIAEKLGISREEYDKIDYNKDYGKEEHKKCMFTKEEFTEEDRKVLCEDCKEECEYAKKEEPVSEDLEEAADCYKDMITPEDVDDYEHAYFYETYTEYQIADAFKAGAKWQEKQDQSTIELAEDHAMLAGMEKMKEQMMKDAIDAHCFGFQGAALFSFRLPAGNYLVDSEVKVIVIKEDEL